jgi:hypothetical protein
MDGGGRPAGAIGGACSEDGASEGEAGQARNRDATLGGDGKVDAGFARSTDLIDRSRFALDGDQWALLRSGWLQRAGGGRYRASSHRHARGDEERLRSGSTCQHCLTGEGCSSGRQARSCYGSGLLQRRANLTCHEAGIAVTLPKPMTSGIEAKGRFGKQDFVYLSDEDAIAVRPARS